MYTVTLEPSGHQFTADEHELLLDAGLRQGIALPYGCRGGSCGSCAATLLQGAIDYPEGEPMGLAPYDHDQGRVFLCQAVASSDVTFDCPQVGVEQDIEVKALPVRVEGMRRLNHDVMELTLKLPASERLRFKAGQYIDILWRGGKRRGFSLANAPYNDQYLELHIRLVPDGQFTTHVFEHMKPKALLRIEGPLGSFYVREGERPLILMGGGTGLAPLKGMLEQMKEQGFSRPVTLYWGVRTREDLYLDALLKDWSSRHAEFTYIPVLSEPGAGADWEGRTGWVHEAVLADTTVLAEYDVYMSGPPAMIAAGRKAFQASGLPDAQMFSDSFEYATDTLRAIAAGGE